MDRTLTTEQKRIDFRPPEDLPPPLDRPTDACLFATSLLTAAAKAVQQLLHGTNGSAFTSEVSSALRLLGSQGDARHCQMPPLSTMKILCAQLPMIMCVCSMMYWGSCMLCICINIHDVACASNIQVSLCSSCLPTHVLCAACSADGCSTVEPHAAI